ncbi:MAG TPA: response regulator transcription factor [Ktedonobacterales bacterium]
MITLFVVDDHPIVRQGLVAALEDEPDFQVVGAVGSAEDALASLGALQPNVVLLDLELPGIGGVAAIPQLLALQPGTHILVFTAYDTEERVLGALRAGAKGYLLKGATAAEIARAVRAVASGGSALEPRIAARLVTEMSGTHAAGRHLTAREREVLQLIADGQASKQIARALGISERTVKFHTASLLRKLGADNRAQAVAVAVQRGMLDVRRP